MKTSIQNFAQFLLMLCAFWVLIFGVSQIGANEGRCPFMFGHSELICQMDPISHIQEWQNMFTILPTQNILGILFSLFAILVVGRLNLWSKFLMPKFPLIISDSQSSIVGLEAPNIFTELFSDGILNPKIF